MYLVYLGDPVFVDHTGFQLFQLSMRLQDFYVYNQAARLRDT